MCFISFAIVINCRSPLVPSLLCISSYNFDIYTSPSRLLRRRSVTTALNVKMKQKAFLLLLLVFNVIGYGCVAAATGVSIDLDLE